MSKRARVVEVWAWGKRVGAVAPDERRGCYAFEYDPSWKELGVELAPITLPLNSASSVFLFPNLPERTFHRLPPMLADALPDDFGNMLIDAWMVAHGISSGVIEGMERLSYLGRRGMGALEFKPALGSHRANKATVTVKSLVEETSKFLNGSFADERDTCAALSNIIRVGTSAGGARPKAVIAWNKQTNEIRCGHFEVPEGFEH